MRKFSLSANIEYGFADGSQYIVTPNAQRSIYNIVNDFHSGIHSFTIIGSYGTGKSSFRGILEGQGFDLGHIIDPVLIAKQNSCNEISAGKQAVREIQNCLKSI